MGNITSLNNYRLNSAEFSELPKFSLKGMRKNCKVLKIYDGDTLWLASTLFNDKLYRFNIRMLGYDSPEMKPSKKYKLDHRYNAFKKIKKFL
mgnify:CR=1 FL=1